MIKIKSYVKNNNLKIFSLDNFNSDGFSSFILLNAHLLPQNKLTDIVIEDTKIKFIDEIAENVVLENPITIDCKGNYLTAGLIERHIHGGFDCCFNEKQDYSELQKGLLSHGITSILPTVMTDSIENINTQVEYIKNLKEKFVPKILGIHLEGPFINPQYKGIHPEKFILKPTIENLYKIKNLDFVKLITYAFELDENFEFTKELNKLGIIGSVGHSACDYDTARAAVSNGITQVTHLYNALKQPHHREPALVTSALVNDEFYVEIICDYLHLHKVMVELVLKTKPVNKVLLISDALPCAYSKKDKTIFGGEEIFITNNIARSKAGTIAGSTFFIDEMLKNVGFEKYVNCATKNVAESLNISDIGDVAENKSADLVVWNKDFDVIFNMIEGKILYKK